MLLEQKAGSVIREMVIVVRPSFLLSRPSRRAGSAGNP
jgi:hypothetical protein